MKNKRRTTALFLAFVLIAGLLSGCGGDADPTVTGNETTAAPSSEEPEAEETKYVPNRAQAKINNPWTERPDYTLKEGASGEEMRETVVRAMNDLLSVKWTPIQTFDYIKTASGKPTVFTFDPYTIYAGLPYTDGCGGLFQWYAGIDPENGVLYDLEWHDVNASQGNSCASCVTNALMTACNSIKRPWSTYLIIEKNGFIPLGNIQYPENLQTLKDYSTDRIVQENGEQAMFESYALLLPGDPLTRAGSDEGQDHAMLAIEASVVVRNEDGTIDGRKSYAVIADQRFGEKPREVDGQVVNYRGRTRAEISFSTLYAEYYVAYTLPEYIGEAEYVVPEAHLSKEGETYDDIKRAKIKSNYGIAVSYARFYDSNGKMIYEGKSVVSGKEIQTSVGFDLSVSRAVKKSELEKQVRDGESYRCVISVLLVSGTEIEVADVLYTPD